MVLHFPDADTLRLALTSGAIPANISSSPVEAVITENGEVHVILACEIDDNLRKNLGRFNVRITELSIGDTPNAFSCWPEILPLQAEKEAGGEIPQSTVLFELPDAQRLPDLMTEMLRLGNDRQSFRVLTSAEGENVALLRVQGPPYYSLLQALDRDGDRNAPIAYAEKGPRIWIEIGWNHPLIGSLKAPPKKSLLLRPTSSWRAIDESPFQEIYEIATFPVPGHEVAWSECADSRSFQVPLRLTAGGSPDPAEMWVLRDSPIEQIEELIRGADDRLIDRLSFTVAEADGKSVVLLRARPSRQGPPTLVLKAEAYRSYLKLPNLFVPCGQRIHPPLRRDRIRDLLAGDLDKLTWLSPQDSGGFTVESVPDGAFRALSDWVEYVLSRDQQVLQTWIQSCVFEFDDFICQEEPKPNTRTVEEKQQRKPDDALETPDFIPVNEPQKPTVAVAEPPDALPASTPSEAQKRLQELEERFVSAQGPIDAAERQTLWPELATAYAALGNRSDALVCLANAMWSDSRDAPRLLHISGGSFGAEKKENQIDAILDATEPTSGQIRSLALQLITAANQDTSNPAIVNRLGKIQNLLHEHADSLPVRIVWLTAVAASRLAGRDELHLARTRDLLLERLFATGLRADLDLPAFLRVTGGRFAERLSAFRDWAGGLPGRVRNWLEVVNRAGDDNGAVATASYADLVLAYAFARLGENSRSRDLLQSAQNRLLHRGEPVGVGPRSNSSDVHSMLFEAYRFRIEQALQGEAAIGPLPAQYTEDLQLLERIPKLVVERLLQQSSILDAHANISAFRAVYATDELDLSLVPLSAVCDKRELEEKIAGLFSTFAGENASGGNQRRLIEAALELAPRIGEAFSVQLLDKAEKTLESPMEREEKASLLGKLIYLAAHFDRKDRVQLFAESFEGLVLSLHEEKKMLAIVSLVAKSFRSLCKLGMGEWIERLLNLLETTIVQGKSFATCREGEHWPLCICALLHVAAGYFYFDKTELAMPIVDEARTILYRADLQRFEKKYLACALTTAYSQAPPETALAGADEMFDELTGVFDNSLAKDFFGLWELEIVEGVVLAIASEDFAAGGQVRRWLDEDEYLVRRRIHQDMRETIE